MNSAPESARPPTTVETTNRDQHPPMSGPGNDAGAADHRKNPMNPLPLPAGALCALIGPPGSGKSTFAPKHFKPTEIVSSDFCRGLIADDENDQSASRDAFDLLRSIADKRLKRGRLTVIDATNLRTSDRAWLLARAHHWQRPPVALLFDVPLATVQAQNAARDRVVPAHVVHEFHSLMPTITQLHDEGWDTVHPASAPRT